MTLPGVRTVDHLGITVEDRAAAVQFLVDVLGFEEVYAHVPGGEDAEIQIRQFDRHAETRLMGITMLRLGTLNLEVLEFCAPDQRRVHPRPSDWGGTHLALYVDDLDEAVAHLRRHEVRVLGRPMALPGPESGPGARFIFAVGPGGLSLELVTYPEGKAYETAGGRRLFDPRTQPLSTGGS